MRGLPELRDAPTCAVLTGGHRGRNHTHDIRAESTRDDSGANAMALHPVQVKVHTGFESGIDTLNTSKMWPSTPVPIEASRTEILNILNTPVKAMSMLPPSCARIVTVEYVSSSFTVTISFLSADCTAQALCTGNI
jgi:hypothetical protein